MVRPRVRIRFSKQDDLRWIGHRDLMRCLERVFRRAELALAMSEGFHPKPRMTFPLALAVGIAGRDEVMELELTESPSSDALLARLAPQAPAGLRFLTAATLPEGTRKARAVTAAYQIAIPPPRHAAAVERVGQLLETSSHPIRRPNRAAAIDLRASLVDLALGQDGLVMRLRTDPGGSAGPRDVLAALGLDDLEREGVPLTRTTVEIDA
jgi:radical SAM-linked protein